MENIKDKLGNKFVKNILVKVAKQKCVLHKLIKLECVSSSVIETLRYRALGSLGNIARCALVIESFYYSLSHSLSRNFDRNSHY